MTRLQRFRAYMARMNPSGDPKAALDGGLYVPRPGRTIAEDLAKRLELEPTSTHLVLGGIGSGKTMELLRAAERLGASLSKEGDHVAYCDVSLHHDLGASKLVGVLVALAGLSLAAHAEAHEEASDPSSPLAAALTAVKRFAHGETEWVDDVALDEPMGNIELRIPGVLHPPQGELPRQLREIVPHLKAVTRAHPGGQRHAVLMFDSLDRLSSPERFREAVQHDLRVLKAAGIGVVVVGPLRFMVGAERSVVDLFDRLHLLPAEDPDQPESLSFLMEVLRRRAELLLPEAHLDRLARASGGVMRDLLALAKRAGEEAYAAGHDQIAAEDLDRAIDAFGRTLAFGLDADQLNMLRHLQRNGGFVVRGEREVSLLETRRVLLYGESRFAVHPALIPQLGAMPEITQ